MPAPGVRLRCPAVLVGAGRLWLELEAGDPGTLPALVLVPDDADAVPLPFQPAGPVAPDDDHVAGYALVGAAWDHLPTTVRSCRLAAIVDGTTLPVVAHAVEPWSPVRAPADERGRRWQVVTDGAAVELRLGQPPAGPVLHDVAADEESLLLTIGWEEPVTALLLVGAGEGPPDRWAAERVGGAATASTWRLGPEVLAALPGEGAAQVKVVVGGAETAVRRCVDDLARPSATSVAMPQIGIDQVGGARIVQVLFRGNGQLALRVRPVDAGRASEPASAAG